jgi:FkbM family methyltransferase
MIFIKDQYHVNKFLKKDSVVIDGGAHIGLFSIFAAELAYKGRVLAFEPANKTFKILSKNISYFSNITPVHAALGSEPGQSKILISDRISGENCLIDSKKDKKINAAHHVEDVVITSIDQTVVDHKLPKVDFIKLDCEGYERNIILGAKKTIKNFSPTIAVSAYHAKDDKEIIPQIILSINPQYKYELSNQFEEDLIFWIP